MIRTIPEIEFVKGITHDLEKESYFDVNVRNLIVIDDQMTETANDKRIVNLFTKGSHHRNLSVIYMVQNLFHQGKGNRDISLNYHYLVIFKSPRDQLQVLNLAKQMNPGQTQIFLQKYEQAVSRPYGYLFLDLKTTTPDDCRFQTNIFPGEKKVEQEPQFHRELLDYLQGQKPPEMTRMQELQRKMGNILVDPYINESQKARQYTELQKNLLRYKQKMNYLNKTPKTQPEPLSTLKSPAPAVLPMDSNTTEPLEISISPSPPENVTVETPSPISVQLTENLITQTPILHTSSPLTPPPSSILTPPESMSRKRPYLKLKNYMEDPMSIKKPRLRRSIRMKNRFPYKYEK